jgi:hypothetical protein
MATTPLRIPAANGCPRQDDDAMPGFADRNAHIRGIAPHRNTQQLAIDLAIVVPNGDDCADRDGAILESGHNGQPMELMMYGR